VAGSVPWRSSLRARLLVTSVLIALCSVVATAWLAVTTTTRDIQQQQGQVLSGDATIYNTLLGYAATHPDWAGVAPVVRDLAARTGLQIALTAQDHGLIAGSMRVSPQLTADASAVIDPLNVDQAISSPQVAGIDPRAVGPFRLTQAEQATLLAEAEKTMECLRSGGWHGVAMTVSASGRPVITVAGYDDAPPLGCGMADVTRLTATEARALHQLNLLVHGCLVHQHLPAVQVNADFTWTEAGKIADGDQVHSCINASRREQLRPYVAPAALLFVTRTEGPTSSGFTLTPASRDRIIEVTALVLALTVAITSITSTRLIMPLSRLTEAVRHPETPYAPVPVSRRDEIGYLTAAFNDVSERRERTEEQRKALISDIAHELRTPLGNIRGWLEAAADGLAAPDKALTSSLFEEAMLLQHIIDDLQDLAAADAGQLRLHHEPVHVTDLLQQVADAHRGCADAGGVRLQARTEGDPELTGDPVRLRQAIGNLASNAVRHTGPGGYVTLTGCAMNDEVMIEVADTGSGISPGDLPRIFDRFWRADKSRSRRTGGSGLGLPIARQLIEAHGGRITAASTEGHGTVFTVSLPMRPGHAGLRHEPTHLLLSCRRRDQARSRAPDDVIARVRGVAPSRRPGH
jgi:two-component system, OmpR family, sensor histidine kinase BaeS